MPWIMQHYKLNSIASLPATKGSSTMKMGKGGNTVGSFGKATKKGGLLTPPLKPAGKSR